MICGHLWEGLLSSQWGEFIHINTPEGFPPRVTGPVRKTQVSWCIAVVIHLGSGHHPVSLSRVSGS